MPFLQTSSSFWPGSLQQHSCILGLSASSLSSPVVLTKCTFSLQLVLSQQLSPPFTLYKTMLTAQQQNWVPDTLSPGCTQQRSMQQWKLPIMCSSLTLWDTHSCPCSTGSYSFTLPWSSACPPPQSPETLLESHKGCLPFYLWCVGLSITSSLLKVSLALQPIRSSPSPGLIGIGPFICIANHCTVYSLHAVVCRQGLTYFHCRFLS